MSSIARAPSPVRAIVINATSAGSSESQTRHFQNLIRTKLTTFVLHVINTLLYHLIWANDKISESDEGEGVIINDTPIVHPQWEKCIRYFICDSFIENRKSIYFRMISIISMSFFPQLSWYSYHQDLFESYSKLYLQN